MKLTENVLKQTIREVISELLEEDSRSDGGFEPPPAPSEDELIPVDPPKFPPPKKVTPPKNKKKRRTVLPDPSKPSKDNNKKKVKEDIDEIFSKSKDVETALSKTAPKKRKKLPVKQGVPKKEPGESNADFKRRVLNLTKEDIDEVSGVPVAKDDDFDPIAASESLNMIAGVDGLEEELDPVGQEDGDINNDGKKDSSDKYLKNRRKAIGKNMKKGDVSEQEMPEPKLPKVPEVEPPGTTDATPKPAPKAPPGGQTKTPMGLAPDPNINMSLKEQVSAKHNRIFESLVKSVTKK